MYPDYVDKPTHMRSNGLDYIVTRVRVSKVVGGRTNLDWENVWTLANTNPVPVPVTAPTATLPEATPSTNTAAAATATIDLQSFQTQLQGVKSNFDALSALADKYAAAQTNEARLRQALADNAAALSNRDLIIANQQAIIEGQAHVIELQNATRSLLRTTGVGDTNSAAVTNTTPVSTNKP
jgi:hypothetical protein